MFLIILVIGKLDHTIGALQHKGTAMLLKRHILSSAHHTLCKEDRSVFKYLVGNNVSLERDLTFRVSFSSPFFLVSNAAFK